jgi:hypothetical protein
MAQTTEKKEQEVENSLRQKNNIPSDAYRLPSAEELYNNSINAIWPQLCSDSKAQMRYLRIVHEALKKEDNRFSNIYIIEPELNFETGKPSGESYIFAPDKTENASGLAQIMLLVYEKLIKEYVLTDKNKGKMIGPNDIGEDKIRAIYKQIAPEIESKTKKPETTEAKKEQ